MSDTDGVRQPLWTNEQLATEAEVIVAGRYGTHAVYGVLKMIRDDCLADRAATQQQLTIPKTVRNAIGEMISDWDNRAEAGSMQRHLMWEVIKWMAEQSGVEAKEVLSTAWNKAQYPDYDDYLRSLGADY